jgi:Flp pilus assembly protein TadB
MSSALLYLAIVAVWGVVLVPMWLRRDGSRTRQRRFDEDTDTLAESPAEVADNVDEALPEDHPAPAPQAPQARQAARRRASRAAVIARRRRRTVGLLSLGLTAVATVVAGVTPWWFIAPPAVLLVGHLTLLRIAFKVDAERRRARHLARLRAMEAERRRAEEQARLAREAQRTAEVITMPERPQEEVYDQYTDQRAVGD